MVGLFGFEPKTSSMSTKRSNQLSYNPMSDECIIHDMREICKMLFTISCRWAVMRISTLQLAIWFIWITVSVIDAAEPICFKSIYQDSQKRTSYVRRVMTKHCMKMHAKSDSAIESAFPKCKRMPLCTHPQIVCMWGYPRNQISLYKRIPRLTESCKAGCSYHCSLVGLSGFEPETSSM